MKNLSSQIIPLLYSDPSTNSPADSSIVTTAYLSYLSTLTGVVIACIDLPDENEVCVETYLDGRNNVKFRVVLHNLKRDAVSLSVWTNFRLAAGKSSSLNVEFDDFADSAHGKLLGRFQGMSVDNFKWHFPDQLTLVFAMFVDPSHETFTKLRTLSHETLPTPTPGVIIAAFPYKYENRWMPHFRPDDNDVPRIVYVQTYLNELRGEFTPKLLFRALPIDANRTPIDKAELDGWGFGRLRRRGNHITERMEFEDITGLKGHLLGPFRGMKVRDVYDYLINGPEGEGHDGFEEEGGRGRGSDGGPGEGAKEASGELKMGGDKKVEEGGGEESLSEAAKVGEAEGELSDETVKPLRKGQAS